MNIEKAEDISKLLAPTATHILKMFDSTEKEFIDLTIQEGFKFTEKNKVQKLAKTSEFWEGYKLNLTKFSVEFKDGIMKENPKQTKEQNLKLFFSGLAKYSLK